MLRKAETIVAERVRVWDKVTFIQRCLWVYECDISSFSAFCIKEFHKRSGKGFELESSGHIEQGGKE